MIDVLLKIVFILIGGFAVSVICGILYFFWIAVLLYLKGSNKGDDYMDWFI
jgi:hypothetical protein